MNVARIMTVFTFAVHKMHDDLFKSRDVVGLPSVFPRFQSC